MATGIGKQSLLYMNEVWSSKQIRIHQNKMIYIYNMTYRFDDAAAQLNSLYLPYICDCTVK